MLPLRDMPDLLEELKAFDALAKARLSRPPRPGAGS